MFFGGGRFPQTCNVCQDSTNPQAAQLRAEWGCDAPTVHPQFSMECPRCEGHSTGCQDCGGTGQIDVHRCPRTFVAPVHVEICRAAALVEVGVLPEPGGFADQAATCVDALGIVVSAREEYREQERKRRERNP